MTAAEIRTFMVAEAAVYALWCAAHSRRSWQKVLGGHNPHRASFLPVILKPIPQVFQFEELRIWRRDLEAFMAERSMLEREELQAHIAKSRYQSVFRHRPKRGRVERGNVPGGLAQVALELGQIVLEVKREPAPA